MTNHIVSVIVPTKNSASTLEKCLASIKNQSYKHIEIIVIDNFSSDETPQIAKKYTKLFFQKGPERSAQRNYGVKNATGEYVFIIDSDMNLDSEVVRQCANTMAENPKVTGMIVPEESFGEGFWAQCKKLERSFYIGVPYMEAARFFKKSDFLKVGGYDKKMVSGEDWDLSQRIKNDGLFEHTAAIIHHNEGHISLFKTIKKKFYYAQLFKHYAQESRNAQDLSRQTSIIGRYALFFSQPKKLFKNPIIGLGMLFMKTCEFGFGAAGYLKAKAQRV